MPKFIRRMLVVAAVAGLALAQLPAASRADDAEPPTGDGPRTLAKYAACAGGLAFAPNVYTAFMAFMACVKMFTEEMPV